MQGQQPPPFIPAAAGAPPLSQPQQQQQQQIHLNPNFFANPNNLFFLHQNPAALLPHLNPFFQNPNNFPPFQPPFIPNNNTLPVQSSGPSTLPVPSSHHSDDNGNLPQKQAANPQSEMIGKLDKAAKKARRKLVSSNENVSAWKVSQKALLKVKAESWESLGFQMQQVPSLNQLLLTEGKVNAFIHCFVAARRITSLYDLEVEICESEGIERFEELELGPFVRHPLIMHYFAVTSDVTEVYRIRTEEIISYLFNFMETHANKEVKVNTFMDFISKKLSVNGREKLCIRIQSFGMYVKQIEQARQSEDFISKKCFEKIRRNAVKRSNKQPVFCEEKKQLDDHFTEISERMKSFSSETTQFCGKHIRFESSSSENDSENNEFEDNQDKKNTPGNCNLPVSSVKPERVSSCPYPSATEEMTRLGLKTEADCIPYTINDGVRCNEENTQSRRKRKSKSAVSTDSAPQKRHKRHRSGINVKPKSTTNRQINSHSLTDESLKMFIRTWKEECRANNADEVLEKMILFYNTKKKNKVQALFTSYPFVGLLNAAVMYIKSGMWDTTHDTFQAIGEQGVPESSSDHRSADNELAKEGKTISARKIRKHKQDITAEDIAKKISRYFEDDMLSYKTHSRENKFSFLRKLCECEGWLCKRYSINGFESLGYGEYFLFLEKYMHLLPRAFQECLIGGIREKVSLEAHLLPLQLDILLSQTISSLLESETINLKTIAELLSRQFPLVCFELLKNDQRENLVDTLREKGRKMTSNCVLFSAPLLRLNCIGDSLDQSKKKLKTTSYLDKEVMTSGVTTNGAIEVLLNAPMLSDLKLWSHWDLLFAPSLGSIVEWLLKEINANELLCLVTKDGKVIRVNHSATVDSLLKVFIQGSAFETAVELLSIFVLYGGERNVPLSLLKCHARKAFEVIMNNMLEVESHDDENPIIHNQYVVGINLSSNIDSSLPNNSSRLDKTVQLMSRFILDCLSYLPIEFCSYAADVLISGLQPFVKGVPSAILTECKQMEQRLMLHEVGMSLGLIEWVNDYHSFHSSMTNEFSPESTCLEAVTSRLNTRSEIMQDAKKKTPSGEMLISSEADYHDCSKLVNRGANSSEVSAGRLISNSEQLPALGLHIDNDPAGVIEAIRREEFGLDQSLSATENRMLKKQHARLGRALHCLSQELYSQDSHFLLELVQNADDNIYPEKEEPTLTFILQEKGIIVLNNEMGFLPNNIRALCDVGNSTKKGHNSGYIGKKGIGFKSVFRVTDAPEIHSNGFHIKFDITNGQIGFVLPSIVPPCDIGLYSRLASTDADGMHQDSWNTCIVLPFRTNLSERFALNKIVSMFSDLHPSLLLFLHRLQCIKFRNLLDDSLIVMRKEIIGDGIIQVSLGNEKVTWFVVSEKLQDIISSDAKRTEISIAFTLQEKDDGEYIPVLNQQPVFSFLPLRTYGLKFILQGDFVLPSSREEVDRNSPWNQWLLSEFPDLFVRAERLFCDLPCYKGNPGKAVMAFLSFVPLNGEVHGFFSSLPRMIISKLRMSSCLILEGDERKWVPPCKVLRNWTDQARSLLPDSLLHEHLGLGFLNKDIVLSDSLASALGVEDYGPKILLRIISSLCHSEDGLKSMGLSWLSSWLSAMYVMLSHSSIKSPLVFGNETDFISELQKILFVPLSSGKFGSVYEDTIWLQSDEGQGIDEHILKAFPKLYARLRIVSPNLLAAVASIESSCSGATTVENVTRMLYKVGVQRLSAHEILTTHILPAICDNINAIGQENLMIEYLSFAMFHLQSGCTTCGLERDGIVMELREKAMILTNYGYKRFNEVPLHFNQEYKNSINVNKLISGLDVKWHEIDSAYLKHPITRSLSDGVLKWRSLFQDMGVTDFVQIVQVEKRVGDMSFLNIKEYGKDTSSVDSVANDWKSEELFHILSLLSSSDDREKSIHLLEILDTLWDSYFSDKLTSYCIDSTGDRKLFKSSLLSSLQDVPWVVSNIDYKLHYPKDLFHECVAVNSVLGVNAPYTIPKVRSEKLLADIGLKTEVTLDDALYVLRLWRRSESFFKASVSEMSNFYRFLWTGMSLSKKKIIEELHSGPFIFVPHTYVCSQEDAASGALMSPQDLYWHDNIGSVGHKKSVHPEGVAGLDTSPQRKMLCSLYPTLHDFFVNECGVNETPPFHYYLQILQQLSATALPHEAAETVFEVFLIWADALIAGSPSLEDVECVKESILKKECTVLPTRQDRWVSLHASFGEVCWCDNENLGREFKQVEGVNFLYLWKSIDEENQILRAKVSVVMQKLGIPALSEIVRREAIYYGPEDCSFIFSLVNWILPYAQRYIYNADPDKYFQLKQSSLENLSRLKIVVVDKLFYRNVIKKCQITSKKRHECNCLLQDNILYCSSGSDTHSIFLEFSRLLFNGNQELHFANFLHMVTTMAQSGATEEQTEFFILNSQKVQKLPKTEESCWSLQSVSSTDIDANPEENHLLQSVEEQSFSVFKKRRGIDSNWPPVDWRTAPGFCDNAFELKKPASMSLKITEAKLEQTDIAPKEISSEFNIDVDQTTTTSGAVSLDSEISEPPPNILSNSLVLDSFNLIAPDGAISVPSMLNSNERDQVSDQAKFTGRLGELVAFRYFVEKVGDGSVKWVNETSETGLPYDIIVESEESREYIEVKATKFERKNWFVITMREWQFAIEKGESFSIAHVILAEDNMARVTIYKNPAKLCQLGNLKLAFVVPKE